MRSRARHADEQAELRPNLIRLDSPIEDLDVSVRTRNALRSIGCGTVGHVLLLDLSGPLRGIGRKTREEVLAVLERHGFRHPVINEKPVADMKVLERSLERIEERIDSALGAVTREIRMLRRRLRDGTQNERTSRDPAI